MTDSKYNDPDFLKPEKIEQKSTSTPSTDTAAYYVTTLEGPTGDHTEEVVPAELCRRFEGAYSAVSEIITELKAVQAFIKNDDEHCPDYSVTKNVYIAQIQRVIDKCL